MYKKYQVLKYDTFPAMTTLLRSLPFGAKGMDMLSGIIPALCLRYLFFYAHFKQALLQATHRHTHKTTKKTEVGSISDNENRASFACRWPSLKSGFLSTHVSMAIYLSELL